MGVFQFSKSEFSSSPTNFLPTTSTQPPKIEDDKEEEETDLDDSGAKFKLFMELYNRVCRERQEQELREQQEEHNRCQDE